MDQGPANDVRGYESGLEPVLTDPGIGQAKIAKISEQCKHKLPRFNYTGKPRLPGLLKNASPECPDHRGTQAEIVRSRQKANPICLDHP